VNTTFAAGTVPGAVTVPANSDVSASVGLQWGAPSSGSGTVTFATALNGCCGEATSDITPALAADNAKPGYSPVMYLSIYNPGPNTIVFSASPAITITYQSSGEPGGALGADTSGCDLDLYEGAWQNELPGVGLINTSAMTVSFSSFPTSFPVAPGQLIFAVACP